MFRPRVALPMRAFSSACNLAAKAASSSSSLGFVFLFFFLGGGLSSTSDRTDSSSGGDRLWWDMSDVSPLVVLVPFSPVCVGSEASEPPPFCSLLNLSKRCMMSVVIWSCFEKLSLRLAKHVEARNLLMRQVLADSFLQTLADALRRDGVYVTCAQDVINDDRVRGLDLCGERVWRAMLACGCKARGD